MKKIIMSFLIVALVISASFILSRVTLTEANAAEEAEKTILSFLEEEKIPFSEVSVHDGLLSVKLCSVGLDRCTLEDVKAIQSIYEAVHAQKIVEVIRDVDISVCNAAGGVLFDERENEIAIPLETVELTDNIQMTEKEMTDLVDYSRTLAAAYPVTVMNATVSSAKELSGNKIVLELSSDEYGAKEHAYSCVSAIFDRLEEYSHIEKRVTQCEIVLYDNLGDCILYLSGDFQFGNRIGWVSPSIEQSLIMNDGPREIDD